MSKRMLFLILLAMGITTAQATEAETAKPDDSQAKSAQTQSEGEEGNAPNESSSEDESKEESQPDESGDADAKSEDNADSGAAESSSSKSSGEAKENLVDGDLAIGAKLSPTCAACHGAGGNSTNPVWPKIAGQGAPYIYEQLKLFKSGERENAIMAGIVADLSEEDMRGLAVYFSGQANSGGAADESLVEAGSAIYHGGIPEENVPACSGCHGPAGLGNPAAKYPQISGQHAPYVSAQLKAYRDGERSDYRNGKIMSAVATDLSDEDIEALASYVQGLRPRVEK